MTIKTLSPTRVTLALDIIGRIDEGQLRGYHELGIIKHRIKLADALTVEENGKRDIIECDDARVPCDDANICAKACQLVREKFGINKFVRITLEKKIPVMGGMAGGSANAAAMLSALNDLWKLDLQKEQLCELGLQLGMDVPFFFTGKTAFDSEATGVINPIETNLNFHFILAIPDFGISTKEAYGAIDYSAIGKNVSATKAMANALRENDFDAVLQNMHNDFELFVFERHPQLQNIKNELLSAGCIAAVMTGSGSTIIGMAKNKADAERIAAKISCQTIVTESL